MERVEKKIAVNRPFSSRYQYYNSVSACCPPSSIRLIFRASRGREAYGRYNNRFYRAFHKDVILTISGKINVETRRVDLTSFFDIRAIYVYIFISRFVWRTIIIIFFFFLVKIFKIFPMIHRKVCLMVIQGVKTWWVRGRLTNQEKEVLQALFFCYLIPNHFFKNLNIDIFIWGKQT